MLRVLTVFGTRPETIKMAPLISELAKYPDQIMNENCFTGQHKDMVTPLLELFKINVDYDLQLMKKNQSLEDITTGVLNSVSQILKNKKYDLVLVQGDTTTSMAAAMAAFYSGVAIGHVEAGLRTYDKYSPFPEESNRKIIDAVSDLFFAHSELAKEHLIKEGVKEDKIEVTGNTVIDALLSVAEQSFQFTDPELKSLPVGEKRILLVTAHRRESFGDAFESMCRGLKALAQKYKDEVVLVYPVHRNPNVRKVVSGYLSNVENIVLTDPLDYKSLVHLMKLSYLVLTDSGGIQEEAPSLGKPVLVLRDVTERQEGVIAGTLKLVGTSEFEIVSAASELLEDNLAYEKMAHTINPYGNGDASHKIVKRLLIPE